MVCHVARYEHIGKAIKAARESRKLSQDGLAELVGAKGGRFTVIRWEAGLHKPTEFAEQLIDLLDLDASLFDEDADAPFPGGRGTRRAA